MPSNSGDTSLPRCRLVERFAVLWNGGAIPDVFSFLEVHPDDSEDDRAGVLFFDQVRRQRMGDPRSVEEYFEKVPELARGHRVELIAREFAFRLERSETPGVADYLARFPDLGDELQKRLVDLTEPPEVADGSHELDTKAWGYIVGNEDFPLEDSSWTDEIPERVGKYPVRGRINVGAFKQVLLGRHEGLDLDVAILVPHPHLVATPTDADSFLAEGRTLARLDHPGVIKVYDADRTHDERFRCYLVEQLVDGTDLADRISAGRLSCIETASIVAKVAEALHYVHKKRLVHRDIKPANILIDTNGTPIVSDFGLALKRDDLGKKMTQGGTVAYMSPEQARGEGHLVDGRSDIFSLGVVLYELLTGTLPFDGESARSVLEKIKNQEVCPPRQIDDTVPPELERICLRSLCKRVADRYTTAVDMADDLHYFLEASGKTISTTGRDGSTWPRRNRESGAAPVVPKGLRSFDFEDADFFLQLLPGPRDRHGLPEGVRFWKTLIEELDPDASFRVGFVYGPSGSGKTSLVKAGVLPLLGRQVRTVFIDATPDETELQLLTQLRRRFCDLEANLTLPDTLGELRRGRALPPGQKALIVIDQFEQWLQGASSLPVAELVLALRQCDGEHVQCMILVRDDFWMGLTRFMHQLEIPLVEGKNSRPVDLFDLRHAKKVLTAFGRAHGALPGGPGRLDVEQERFVERAVLELSENEKVISVRLALFAEMFKNKEWLPANLKEVGGTLGVGVRFLEESFGSASVHPHRAECKEAARAVLEALLPEPGTDIKGHMRSRAELLAASGHEKRPRDFDQLMNILDGEMRLLTPTGRAGVAEEDLAESGGAKYYQLTHDYLVPPLREWLTREERETRRGRARLMLDERSSLWNAKPETKQLPSLWEWLTILLLVGRRRWTAAQTNMLDAAARLHMRRSLWMAAALTVVGAGIWFVKYRDDQAIREDVREARLEWERGPRRWEAACGLLREAHRRDREHDAVIRLVSDMFTRGLLTIHTEPPDLALQVEPDPGADEELRLAWNPELFEKTARLRSGQAIPLAIGHYRATIHAPTGEVVLPVFVGHVRYEYDEAADGWNPQWLQHGAMGFNPHQQEESLRFTIAEHVTIHATLPPGGVPSGFVYIAGGPYWRTADPRETDGETRIFESTRAGKKFALEFKVHDGRDRLEYDHLPYGFIIARAETTIDQLTNWFERHGTEFCRWRVAIDSRIPEAVTDTVDVPPAVVAETWGADPSKYEDAGEILEEALKAITETWRKQWDPIRDSMPRRLSGQGGGSTPVAVLRDVAIAYARTHAPIDSAEFESWVVRKIADASRYAAELEAVKEAIAGRAGEFVDPGELPPTRLIRQLRGPPEDVSHVEPLLDGYVAWFIVRSCYGWQVPIERIRTWATGAGVEPSEISEHTWLWPPPSKGATGYRHPNWAPRALVDAYASAIGEGRERPLREHVVRWLGWMVEVERRERAEFEELLTRLTPGAAAATIDGLSFGIRYRYGEDLGWDIPTWKQWEKAYRGPDARLFAWGDHEDRFKAWLDRSNAAGMLRADARAMVPDVTAHGILHMAGNASEWVRVGEEWERFPRHFLKGGNYALDASLANAGYTLSVPAASSAPWTGFRIVREIRGFDPPPANRKRDTISESETEIGD